MEEGGEKSNLFLYLVRGILVLKFKEICSCLYQSDGEVYCCLS